MSCETCSEMRMAYVQAVIAGDVRRVAGLTVAAVQHMIGGDDGTGVRSICGSVDEAEPAPDAGGVQAGGGIAGRRIAGSAMGDGQHG